MKSLNTIILSCSLLLFLSCQKESNRNVGPVVEPEKQVIDWLIPPAEVLDGGPGKDGIPALENPPFVGLNEISYLTDEDLVLGYANGEDVRVYPHAILNWHEIINDDVEDQSIAVIYCPLTGTGIGWSRYINDGPKTTFGVSGLLYNSNIIPYDRQSHSNWSQMLLKSVNGEQIGNPSANFILVETTWKTWKSLYPDSKVVSSNTGHSRDYTQYPYGGYRSNHNALLFPVSHSNDQYPNKQRALGIIINEKAKTYSLSEFPNHIIAFNDHFQQTDIVIAGSKTHNFIVAFNARVNGEVLNFKEIRNSLPIILEDAYGNKYDIFGKCIEGPNKGKSLRLVTNFMGFWFAWAAFYPDMEIYKSDQPKEITN